MHGSRHIGGDGSLRPAGFFRSVLPALVVVLAVPSIVCGAAYVSGDYQQRLKDVIQNAQDNELLYENREVIWHTTYRIERPKRPLPEMLVAADEEGRHVSQGGLIYLEIVGTQQASDAKPHCMDTLQVYDGTTFVAYEQKIYATVANERRESPRILRPHTILLRRAFVGFPLSTFLRGDDAIKAHPNGTTFSDFHLSIKYVGEEEIQGLACHKILIEVSSNDAEQEKLARHNLWLAPKRNYIPIRQVGYDLITAVDMPIEEGVAEDFREISPGVWFPFSVVHTVYDDVSIVEDKALVPAWSDVHIIKRASLDPDYDVSLFRDIEIPDGVPVYVVENGKIVRDYVQGSPGSPGASFGISRERWILVICSVIALLVVVLLILLRRRRVVGT